MPTTLENVGLFVNTSLVKVPKTWAQLEKSALAFKRKSADNLAIAVQQGANGDAYHMYPFFSGLCGYVFGKTKGGSLNPSNIGLGSKAFLKNASLIDKWNREGLITSKVDGSTAQHAFLKGQAAFWITGPWNIDTVRKAGIKFQIIQVPKIKCRAAPFLGVNGFMVTKFAGTHGIESAAKDLVVSYMAGANAQQDLAAADARLDRASEVLCSREVQFEHGRCSTSADCPSQRGHRRGVASDPAHLDLLGPGRPCGQDRLSVDRQRGGHLVAHGPCESRQVDPAHASGRCDCRDRLGLFHAASRAAQVSRSRHDLPDRIPGDPGHLHGRGRVHELLDGPHPHEERGSQGNPACGADPAAQRSHLHDGTGPRCRRETRPRPPGRQRGQDVRRLGRRAEDDP